MEGAAKIGAALSVPPCVEGEGSRDGGGGPCRQPVDVCEGLQVTLRAPSRQTRRIRSGTGGDGGEIFHGAGEKVTRAEGDRQLHFVPFLASRCQSCAGVGGCETL